MAMHTKYECMYNIIICSIYKIMLNARVIIGLVGLSFYNSIPNALSETNKIWTVSSIRYRRSDAKIFGSVCLVVCKKIDARIGQRKKRLK